MNEHFLTDRNEMISFQSTLKFHIHDKLYAFDSHVKYTIHLHIQFYPMHIILSISIHFRVNDGGKRNDKYLNKKKKPKYIQMKQLEIINNMIKICLGVRCSMVPITTTTTTTTTAIITAPAHAYAYENGNEERKK